MLLLSKTRVVSALTPQKVQNTHDNTHEPGFVFLFFFGTVAFFSILLAKTVLKTTKRAARCAASTRKGAGT